MKEIIFKSISNALSSSEAALIALDEMNANLTGVMRKLIYPGQIIDISYDQNREWEYWLLNVKTLRGNDRGAKKFRIETEVTVEARADAFELARWSCEATPINKDGKDINGRSHGADGNRPTVKIVGNIMPAAPCHLKGAAYRMWCAYALSDIIDKSLKNH